VNPSMDSLDFSVRQTSPGRYIGEFDVNRAGNYFITLTVPNPGGTADGNTRPVTNRTGINVPYSAEFRDRETNQALLDSLVGVTPKGGKPGKVIEGPLVPEISTDHPLLSVNTFHHNLAKAVSSLDIWHWLIVVAGCVFLGDVFIRRVHIHFYWILPMLAFTRNRLMGRQQEAEADQRIERLRSRKKQIGAQIDERRASARFEPQPDQEVREDLWTQDMGSAPAPSERKRPEVQGVTPPDQPTEETYTERLLKAKQKVRNERKKGTKEHP